MMEELFDWFVKKPGYSLSIPFSQNGFINNTLEYNFAPNNRSRINHNRIKNYPNSLKYYPNYLETTKRESF